MDGCMNIYDPLFQPLKQAILPKVLSRAFILRFGAMINIKVAGLGPLLVSKEGADLWIDHPLTCVYLKTPAVVSSPLTELSQCPATDSVCDIPFWGISARNWWSRLMMNWPRGKQSVLYAIYTGLLALIITTSYIFPDNLKAPANNKWFILSCPRKCTIASQPHPCRFIMLKFIS